MKLWPRIRDSGWLEDLLSDASSVRFWTRIFQSVYEGHIDTWDYQWTYACWIQSGLSIFPSVNLVSNIGFNAEDTHTKGRGRLANMPVEAISFPLRHPPFMIRDARADDFTQKNIFEGNKREINLLTKIYRRLLAIRRKVKSWL